MRKTKIICTLGPSTDNEQVLRELMLNGMDVARFNMSHQTHEYHLERIKLVKRLRDELNLPIAMLLDTKGPEIRTELLEGEPLKTRKFFSKQTKPSHLLQMKALKAMKIIALLVLVVFMMMLISVLRFSLMMA